MDRYAAQAQEAQDRAQHTQEECAELRAAVAGNEQLHEQLELTHSMREGELLHEAPQGAGCRSAPRGPP